MKILNLKDIYPQIYNEKKLCVVNDEVYKIVQMNEKMEVDIVYMEMDMFPTESENKKMQIEYLSKLIFENMLELPVIQSNRIYEHYYLNFTKTEIARIEERSECAIRKSIKRGLNRLRKTDIKYFY